MRGRRRRGRPHLKRQGGIVFQPGGGLLLDSGGQADSPDGLDEQSPSSDPTGAGFGNQPLTTGHVQTHNHPAVTTDSRPSSSEAANEPTLSTILFAPTSLGNVISVAPTGSPASGSSSAQSLARLSSSSINSSEKVSPPSLTSSSAAATLNVSQSSAVASSAPNRNAVGHSVEFYGGIVFGSIIALACLLSFVAWLVRSQRRPICCSGGKEDEDVENQDLGFGLGIYLDKPTSALDSQEVKSTPVPELARGTSQANPSALPAIQNTAASPSRYLMTTTRPSAAHLFTNDTVHSPSRVLGPLQIKNYVSGDFPSSCDEGAISPKLGHNFNVELRTAREPPTAVTPRFLGMEGQGLGMPWSPLNIKSSHAPGQVNVAKSPSKKSAIARADGEEDMNRLPTPRFSSAHTPRDDDDENSDGWGTTLRSSIFNALLGLAGRSPKPEEDRFTRLPASCSYSTRRFNPHSSYKPESGALMASESRSSAVSESCETPKVDYRSLSFMKPGPSMAGLSFAALEMKLAEQDVGDRPASGDAATLFVQPSKRVTKTRRKACSESVKSRTMSRASSIYSPLPGAAKLPSKRMPKGSKRGRALTQPSLTVRPRPEFLRQPTTDSVASFSSEASEPSRDLTEEEICAKRMLMLRARRKRGMGMGADTGRRLTISNALNRRSSSAVPSRASNSSARRGAGNSL